MADNIFKSFNLKFLLICFLYSSTEGAQTSRSLEFDLGGILKKVTTSDHCSITYEYDQLQQLSKVTDSQGKVFQYQYDANGNCIQIEDEHGITKYVYDLLNKLIAVSYPGMAPLHYSYDHRGRLQQIIYPGGIRVAYSYDTADRLIAVNFLDGRIEYLYDQATNTLSKITFPNGITTEYGYDKAKRVVGYELDKDLNAHLTYDMEILDPKGAKIADFYDLPALKRKVPSRFLSQKADQPMAFAIECEENDDEPNPPGTFIINATLKDHIVKKDLKLTTTFELLPPEQKEISSLLPSASLR